MSILKNLLHQELISCDHYCKKCGRTKKETQFKVYKYSNNRRAPYPEAICIECLHEIKAPTKAEYRVKKRQKIKDEFDKYFQIIIKKDE